MFWKKSIKVGDMYACQAGKYVGQMLIYIDKNQSEYGFLSTPLMNNVWVPIDEFDFGVNNGIVEYVERVPKEVRKVTIAQFKSNKEVVRSSN